jgi:hypothetical protein
MLCLPLPIGHSNSASDKRTSIPGKLRDERETTFVHIVRVLVLGHNGMAKALTIRFVYRVDARAAAASVIHGGRNVHAFRDEPEPVIEPVALGILKERGKA